MGLQTVLAQLAHPEPSQRREALVRLAKTKDPRALPYLFSVADGDPSPDLRYLARKGIQFIQANAPKKEGQGTRGNVRASLSERNPANLVQNLAHEDPRVRARAVRLTSLDRHQTLIPHLLRRLREEEDPRILGSVLEALGVLGDGRICRQLIPFLKAPDARVRANAIEAVGRLEHEVGLAYLVSHLRDPDNRCRANAIMALRHSGRVNVFRSLENMIRIDNPSMQDSATFCLGQMGQGNEVFRLLELAAESKYRVTRNQTRKVLEKLEERKVPRATVLLDRLGRSFETGAEEEVLDHFPITEAETDAADETWIDPAQRAQSILEALQGIQRSQEPYQPDESRAEKIRENLDHVEAVAVAPEGPLPADLFRSRLETLKLKIGEEEWTDIQGMQEEISERLRRSLEELRAEGSGDFQDPREMRQVELRNALAELSS